MKVKKFICPKCRNPIKIVNDFDYDSLISVYYPQCISCGFTTHEVFQSEEAVKNFLDNNCN